MRSWTALPDERFVMYAPIGLRLIDDVTGKAPVGLQLVDELVGPARGRMTVKLFELVAGELLPSERRATITPSTIVTYTGLGREHDPGNAAPRSYEIRIDADWYRPLYRATTTGVSFTAFPYDDLTPPASVPTGPIEIRLTPGPAYPFENHVPVLRGQVTDGGTPTADVLVSATMTVAGNDLVERCLTIEDGQFALPLRWAVPGTPLDITAEFTPSGDPPKSGTIAITPPDDLRTNQQIALA